MDLPITHMTLYKHGVGFYERRARVSGEEVQLSFRVDEMNDVLKSLTVIDWTGAKVLGVDYATPRSRAERLAGCSIRLGDDRSLRDLLAGLRGRGVRLMLDQEEVVTGILLGLDEVPDRQPMATSQVSVLLDQTNEVQTLSLDRLHGLELLDERAAGDLRFFLETALGQEEYRRITIRLHSGEHDLTVGYVAPAPTWRVSYRLVIEPAKDGRESSALLQAWGIFDNQLEEDLSEISLSLVAGMPISFVYELYTPFTPDRPVVEEEARVAAGPVVFAGARARHAAAMENHAPEAALDASTFAARGLSGVRRAISREALERATLPGVKGEDLGELFQYVIKTPVTVRRGHSAMVPIVSTSVTWQKDLFYNGSKMATHPVATLRLENQSGLTLERGPVTVIEHGEYVGEAILPFTAAGDELVVPYAVELGIKVTETAGSGREVRALDVRGAYLHIEEWDTRWREYQLNNHTGEAARVLVEHPSTRQYDVFDSPEPVESADEHDRFEVLVPPAGEAALKVQERRLLRRREELQKQSFQGLQEYLRQGLLDGKVYNRVAELLTLWDREVEKEQHLKEAEVERQKVYETQRQIQGNLSALSTTGKEGNLRARYVEQLGASEDQLRELARRELDLKTEVESLRKEIESRLQALQ